MGGCKCSFRHVHHAVTIASLLFRQRTRCHNLSQRKWPTKFKRERVCWFQKHSENLTPYKQQVRKINHDRHDSLEPAVEEIQVWLESRRATFCPLLLGCRLVDDPWLNIPRWVDLTRDLYTLIQLWALSPKTNCRHTKSIYCNCYSSKTTTCHSQTYLQLIKTVPPAHW